MQQSLSEIEILPYANVNGKWSLPDSFIHSFFAKMERDGEIPRVFYDGTVTKSDEFLTLLQNPNNLPVFVLVNGTVLGLAWLNAINGNHASCHFLSLREAWGKESVRMGKKVLDYWFSFKRENGKLSFDVLLGVTPSNYKTVLRFIKEIGCTLCGETPKVLHNGYEDKYMNAVFSYIERPV